MTEREASPNEILKIAVLALIVVVPLYVLSDHFAHPFVNPHLASSPFEWPEGCWPDRLTHAKNEWSTPYLEGQARIRRSCIVEKYHFYDADKYNFPKDRPAGGRNYYRIEDGAVNVYCDPADITENCHVIRIITDVFYDKGDPK